MKNYKGITLVSLVITIIVLLILVAVVVTMSLGENGITNKARQSSEKYNYESAREYLGLKIADITTEIWSTQTRSATLQDIIERLTNEDEVEITIIMYTPTANVDLITDGSTSFNEINTSAINDITVKTRGFIFKIDYLKNIEYIGKYTEREYHFHTFTETINKEPTCVETGEKTLTCSKCDEHTIETIPKLEHVFEEYETIAEPNCTEKGINRGFCTICEETVDQEIPALGHLRSDEYSYSATGHYFSCSRCGESLTEEESHTSSSSCSICSYTGNFTVSYNLYKLNSNNSVTTVSYGGSYSATLTPQNSLAYHRPDNITITMGGNTITSGYTYNNVNGAITISNITGNIVITASAVNYTDNTSFSNALEINENSSPVVSITQAYQIRVYAFVPQISGQYTFYTNDSEASRNNTDDYVYLYSSEQGKTLDQMDSWALEYASTGSYNSLQSNCLSYNDDGGEGYNFSITYNCNTDTTYYIVVRTYTPAQQQTFNALQITKQ